MGGLTPQQREAVHREYRRGNTISGASRHTLVDVHKVSRLYRHWLANDPDPPKCRCGRVVAHLGYCGRTDDAMMSRYDGPAIIGRALTPDEVRRFRRFPLPQPLPPDCY